MGRKLPKVLSEDERDAFLAQFNDRYKTPHRNRLMCRVMLEAGLRVGEVVALEPEHLDMQTCKLTVREGKGAKDRTVWIGEDLRDAIGEWLERRAEDYPESPYLFPNNNGGQVDTSYMRRMVKRTAREADVREAEKVSPHTLRHTFATELYRETKDLRLVQKALGHEDVSTTQIYTHIVDEDLEEAMRNFGTAGDRAA